MPDQPNSSNEPNTSPDKSPDGKGGAGAPKRPAPMVAGMLILGAVLFVAFFGFIIFTSGPKAISYTDFQKLVSKGQILKLTVSGKDKASGEVRDPDSADVKELKLPGGKFTTGLPPSNSLTEYVSMIIAADAAANLTAIAKGDKPPIQVQIEEDQSQWVGPLVYGVLPLVVLVVLFLFLMPKLRDPMGGGFASSFVKSSARRIDTGMNRTTFAEVAGMDNAKRELQEVVEFLKSPEKFVRLGAQVPKGVLLVGSPGTGKTLLARAIAGEAGVPFFSINGSEFIQMFVGVGASRVRDLFRTAKESAPCLIFIDEIDAVGRMRGAGVGGGSDEREQTLNQILGEMDGFLPNESVIVIAATNRPDVLDAALLRPGRFDRHVTVDRPTWQGRTEILKVHVRNKPLADDVDLQKIARQSIGMSGAELKNLANEAAILAARDGKEIITSQHFAEAYERILMGLRREEKVSKTDQRITAYHEAGHTICAWYQLQADPPWKVSVLPRGRALGVMISQPDEDQLHYPISKYNARLVTAMGGRAAERLIYNEASSGAASDLKEATRIARAMVTQFGMSDRLGPVSYRAGEEHVFLGKEIHESRDFSDGTARLIDEEVQRILRESDEGAFQLLVKHREKLESLTNALMDKEEIDHEELATLLGPRPTE